MKKILIVDDDFLIRYSLSHMFQSASVEVVAAETGIEALQQISKRFFVLCFLDIHLPDISGMELMKRIKNFSPRTTIVMMTGGDVTPGMLKEIRSYSELFLSKPFDLFLAKTFVEHVIERDTPPYLDHPEL